MTKPMLIVVVLALATSACGGSSDDSPDGYSPEYRATQMARQMYRWDGDVPPDDVSCEYSYTDGGGASWFEWGGGIHIACSSETTDKPLTGKPNRPRGVWGDCGFD